MIIYSSCLFLQVSAAGCTDDSLSTRRGQNEKHFSLSSTVIFTSGERARGSFLHVAAAAPSNFCYTYTTLARAHREGKFIFKSIVVKTNLLYSARICALKEMMAVVVAVKRAFNQICIKFNFQKMKKCNITFYYCG